MDVKIILGTIIAALILAYIFHSLQRKRNSNKHIGDKVFNIGFVISLTIIAISILVVGGWDGFGSTRGIFIVPIIKWTYFY